MNGQFVNVHIHAALYGRGTVKQSVPDVQEAGRHDPASSPKRVSARDDSGVRLPLAARLSASRY
jgi:hypothetical protein